MRHTEWYICLLIESTDRTNHLKFGTFISAVIDVEYLQISSCFQNISIWFFSSTWKFIDIITYKIYYTFFNTLIICI